MRITTKEAAKILGVGLRQVQNLIKKGLLPAQKAGRDWFLEEEDVKNIQRASRGRPKKEKRMSLTTQHSASSYGLPVLVEEGRAYGPGDVVGDRMAALVVIDLVLSGKAKAKDAEKFLSQMPPTTVGQVKELLAPGLAAKVGGGDGKVVFWGEILAVLAGTEK